MLEPDGSPNTAHSLNPVPLIVTAEGLELRDGGILADVAPTALELLGIAQPASDGHEPARLLAGRSLDRVRATRTGCGSRSPPATAPRAPGAAHRARADRDAGLHPAGDEGDGARAGVARRSPGSATS